jgi:hypothetical protein
VDDDDGQHLLTAAWGRLPASLGRKKFNRLIADGILGGNIALLLGGVPENIDVCALAWVPCAMFRSRTHGPLVSLSVSMAFGNDGAILTAEGATARLYQLVPA